jgi:hypothetical protein
MGKSVFFLFFLVFFILLDVYVFLALQTISAGWHTVIVRRVFVVYWMISLLSVALIIYFTLYSSAGGAHLMRNYLFAFVACLFIAKLIAGLFFLMDDFRRIIQYLASFVFPALHSGQPGQGISRSVFFSWMGFVTGGGLLGSLVYGFGNKYRYKVKNIPLHFKTLPDAFRGFRIVHISDIHSGSFTDSEAVRKGIEMINRQKPDLILFTGDLVNYEAGEMKPYLSIFQSLRAEHGIWAT